MKKFFLVIAIAVVLVGCLQQTLVWIDSPVGGVYVGYHDAPPPTETEARLPEKIILSYSVVPSALDVFLNGQPIKDDLTIGATEAHINFADVREHLVDGINTLTVNPFAMGPTTTFVHDARGPEITIDSVTCVGLCDGGMLTVEVTASDASGVSSVAIQTSTYIWDGGIMLMYPPYTTNFILPGSTYPMTSTGINKYTATVPSSSMYTFAATDVHGYSTSVDYLAPGHIVYPAFKVRASEVLADSFGSAIEAKLSNLNIYGPVTMADYSKTPLIGAVASNSLDTLSAWWKSTSTFFDRVDLGAITNSQAECGYMDLDAPLVTNDFSCASTKIDLETGDHYCIPSDLDVTSARAANTKEGECSRIVLYGVKVGDVSHVNISFSDVTSGRMYMSAYVSDPIAGEAVNVNMGFRNIKCGHRYPTQLFCTDAPDGFCIATEEGVPVTELGVPVDTMSHETKYFCRDVGSVMLGSDNLGDLNVTATSAWPNGSLRLDIFNSSMSIEMAPSETAFSASNMSLVSISTELSDYVAAFFDTAFYHVAYDTLSSIGLHFNNGLVITTGGGASVDIQAHAHQLFTTADNDASTTTELELHYNGLAAAVPSPNVPMILGSIYNRNDLSAPQFAPSLLTRDISVAVSANIINQGLASLYSAGAMHFTVSNFKKDGGPLVIFGPAATDGATGLEKGDTRVLVSPNSPAVLVFNSGALATLKFQGASMDIESYDAGVWTAIAHAKVNIQATVALTASNGKMRMTIAKTPIVKITDLVHVNLSGDGASGYFTGAFGLRINRTFVESALNLVIQYALPTITSANLVIDAPVIPGPLNTDIMTTFKGIGSNTDSHLDLFMDFDNGMWEPALEM